MSRLLSVRNLHVEFSTRNAHVHAVRGVDLDLYPKEIIGIVGESGSGKSALLKAILRLHAAKTSKYGGEILYKENSLLTLSEKQMQTIRGKEIGMIFQDPMTALNPTMKIGKQIAEGYQRHVKNASYAEAKEATLQMLQKVGIASAHDRFNAYPHMLSGGMRQRAMIALALICQPTILLADEPTTALDVTIQAQILDLLKTLQEEMQSSIVLITHDLSVVAQLCDRVLVMYAGQIVESAPVKILFETPHHPYTQKLLQTIPRLDREKTDPIFPIAGTPPNLIHPLPGCPFCPRCTHAMHICAQQIPPLSLVSKEHHTACFLYDPRRQ